MAHSEQSADVQPTTHRHLVLGSQSRSRRKLLHAAGITPVVLVSEIDEAQVAARHHEHHATGRAPAGELVLALAEAKAAEVARRLRAGWQPPPDQFPEFVAHTAVVVAADSMVDHRGETLGKPDGPADAIARLIDMQGSSLTLHTGHCVVDLATGQQASASRATRVDFAAASDAEIRAYVTSGEPLGVAGCFTLEGYAAPFIDGIAGDPSNVMGLSLPLLRRLCADLGVAWLQLVDCGPTG